MRRRPASCAVDRVFGPEVPTGPYKHPACMTELNNGDLYLVYYGGEGEYATDTAVFGSRLEEGQTAVDASQADRPRPVPLGRQRRDLGGARRPRLALLRRSLRRDLVDLAASRSRSRTDHAETWSDASVLSLDEGTWSAAGRSCSTNGDYLLPIYHETGHDPESVGPDSTSLFLALQSREEDLDQDRARSARPRGTSSRPSCSSTTTDWSPTAAAGATTTPRRSATSSASESHDGGMTWSEGKDSAFPNPNAAVDFLKLKSGRLLLIFNDSMNRRTPLTAALSSDQDRTWPIRRNIREGNNDFGYPIALPGRRRPDPSRLHFRPPDGRQPCGLR